MTEKYEQLKKNLAKDIKKLKKKYKILKKLVDI